MRVKYFIRMLLVWLRAKKAPRLGMDDVCRTPMKVNLGDLDIYRHMNNGTYLTLGDLGRMDWMIRTRLQDEFSKRKWYAVVAAQTITYRKSLQLHESFYMETRFLGMEGRDLYLEQRTTVDGEIRSQAFIRGRVLGREGSVTADDLRAALPEGMDIPERIPEWLLEWKDATKLPPSRAAAPSVWE